MPNKFVMFEEITKWVDDGSPVDVIHLDFQKAFDKVPHQTLILKLKSHGMGNSIINWIEQWLTDRRQRVVVDGEVSSWKSVLSGVPQGSVLGPMLFLVYINDLEEGVTGNILKFADDTQLFTKTKEIGDKKNLKDDIYKLVKWSEKWQMLFNFGKCKCLHIGPGNTGMHYEMGGTILSTTVKEKDLGVTMNANMKVSEQCRIAASKGNQVLGMIRRNITYKDKSLIVPLYKAIVRPRDSSLVDIYAYRAVDNALTLFRVWPMRFQRYFYRPPFLGTFARKAPCCCAWYRWQGFRLFAFPANHERRQPWNTTVNR